MALDDRTKALLSTFLLLWMKNNELICNQTYVDSSSDSESDFSTDYSDDEVASVEDLSDTEEKLFEEYRSLQEQHKKMEQKARLAQELEAAQNAEIKIETETETNHQLLEEKVVQEGEGGGQGEEDAANASVLQKRSMLLDEEDYDEPLESETKKRRMELL
ncbi:hypothetical protein K493DRAFT_319956 [Basidiobolus meristosporus CBS 931.73]|uniref:Uncharacterized protein n=1 Tax=Basidiobolus meristosporus CBS 931.73 TaxID=1314790 RepID=A0A1Y1XJF6_9FUNG|nr:hypothetical protein K493DRAFT_319956 [Basidiobolus meristosporus CBS 931.73]|eukprot:ORX85504.1 hypothetical protein K493DRAFT_319956 [Basidiobolus meristosporus CBS 931.73]